MYLFADNAKINKSINSVNDHDIFQHDSDNLTKWSSDWLLNFNPDKCEVLKVVKNNFRDYDCHCESYLAVYIPGERFGGYFKF